MRLTFSTCRMCPESSSAPSGRQPTSSLRMASLVMMSLGTVRGMLSGRKSARMRVRSTEPGATKLSI
eukprot:1802378-Rhodomonas_salina.1